MNLAQYPYKVHEEFGLLIEDLLVGEHPSRPRPQYAWKEKFFSTHGDYHVTRRNAGDEHKVAVANGLFVLQGFSIRPEFLKVAQSTYQCEVTNLDFLSNPQGSAEYINNWVNHRTFGLVPKIVGDSVDPETRLIIANAVYFKAEWYRHFIEGATGL